jgi:hypothetical protein
MTHAKPRLLTLRNHLKVKYDLKPIFPVATVVTFPKPLLPGILARVDFLGTDIF